MALTSPGNLLVAAADPAERMRLFALFSSEGWGVSACADGRVVPSALRDMPADILVMHLVLPGQDGIDVLEQLPAQRLPIYPAVILLYYPGMERFEEHALRAGAAAFLPRETDGLAARLQDVNADSRLYGSRPRVRDAMLLACELGFPTELAGTQYFLTAMEYTLSDYRLLRDMAHGLYPLVANRHGVDAAAVERGIRRAIEAAWQSGAYERQNNLFGNTIDEKRGKPTNGGMLARATEYLRAKEMTV